MPFRPSRTFFPTSYQATTKVACAIPAMACGVKPQGIAVRRMIGRIAVRTIFHIGNSSFCLGLSRYCMVLSIVSIFGFIDSVASFSIMGSAFMVVSIDSILGFFDAVAASSIIGSAFMVASIGLTILLVSESIGSIVFLPLHALIASAIHAVNTPADKALIPHLLFMIIELRYAVHARGPVASNHKQLR